MKCSDLSKYLFAFIDNELSVEQNLDVMEHLNMCARCATLVEEERQFTAVVRKGCCGAEAGENLKDCMETAIMRECGGFRLTSWALYVAAALLLVSLGSLGTYAFFWNHGDARPVHPSDFADAGAFADRMIRVARFARSAQPEVWSKTPCAETTAAFFRTQVEQGALPHQLCIPGGNAQFKCRLSSLSCKEACGARLPLILLEGPENKRAYFTCVHADALNLAELKNADRDMLDGKPIYRLSLEDGVCLWVWQCHMENCYHCMITETACDDWKTLAQDMSYKFVE